MVPDIEDALTVAVEPGRHGLEKGFGGLHPLIEGLQHVRFGSEPKDTKQRRIARAVSRRFQEVHDAVIRCFAACVNVRHHGPTTRLHVGVERRVQGIAQEWPQHRASLVGLGGDEGHDVRVIRTVGGMRVHKNVRIDRMEQFNKREGVAAVHLDEVPVQVQILGIAPEPIRLWTLLVGAGAAISSRGTPHVVLRDDDPSGIPQRMTVAIGKSKPFHGQGQARIHPARFSRVDGVVHQDHGLAALLPNLVHAILQGFQSTHC